MFVRHIIICFDRSKSHARVTIIHKIELLLITLTSDYIYIINTFFSVFPPYSRKITFQHNRQLVINCHLKNNYLAGVRRLVVASLHNNCICTQKQF